MRPHSLMQMSAMAIALLLALGNMTASAADLASAVQKSMVVGALPLLKCMEKKGTAALWPCIASARLDQAQQPANFLKSKETLVVMVGTSHDLGFYITDIYIVNENFKCMSAIKSGAKLHPACARDEMKGELELISGAMEMIDMDESQLVSLLGIKEPIVSEMKAAYGVK
ncbi:hypothetical protein FBZ89_10673 [Nitrospirillum amazonense]|uniref:Uncharacterized protein n=2 Tax=Nitrospirillum amazonense TaxID=28077 RepID=A0A560FGE9_9PROT|nr:hypothetical protein FBZ89_10673 [Nitrospirillum amazonense]